MIYGACDRNFQLQPTRSDIPAATKTSQLKMATDNKILQIAGPIEHILNAIGLALEAALTASDPKPVAYLA